MLNKFYSYFNIKFLNKGLLISPLPAFLQFLNYLNGQEPQNDLQLVVHPVLSSGVKELETNLDKACKSLDPTTTSFEEAFPRYNPNEVIYPKRVIISIFNHIMQLPSNYLKGVMKEFVNNEIKEKNEQLKNKNEKHSLHFIRSFNSNSTCIISCSFYDYNRKKTISSNAKKSRS